ncbi:MAG: Fe-S-containing protein [Lachnospiraceae bacterium]|nr:Fe-S-containing protein [Lachnospiraceae bacterium]
MLYYLELATGVMVGPAITVGLLAAFIQSRYGKKAGRIYTVGIIAGIVLAAIMSYMKNTTAKIDTSLWNSRIFGVGIIVIAVFAVFCIAGSLKKAPKVMGVIAAAAASALAALLLFHALPDVLAYPYAAFIAEQSTFSTSFLLKLIGDVLGVFLCILCGIAAGRLGSKYGTKPLGVFTFIAVIITAVRFILGILHVAITKRWMASNHTLFTLIKFYTNKRYWFSYALFLLVVVMGIILLVRSLHVNEPYRNPAEHRKIRAKWLSIKRWSVAMMVFCGISIFIMTAVRSYNNRPIEVAPIEPYTKEEDGNIYVSVDLLEDGHLHRFAITSDDGTEIRFIAIKKPNSTSYGVGMDACEICGETGYYEKDGQIVCKLCDVVMNVNTIGYPGGCNPLVVEYSVENGYIVIPVEGLLAYEKEFK